MPKFLQNLTWPKLAKITLYLSCFSLLLILSIGFFKYLTYQYNGLDLAIYNQVFFNTSIGHLFQFSIHPTSYLGDHLEPIIFLLIPFYSLWRSPLLLIILQAVFLIGAIVPLFLLAKKHLTLQLTLLLVCLYLFNPLILNMAIFEFHALAFAPFFLLWAFYFYDQKKFRPFLIFCFLALLVREDVAFAVFMFGILALLDKKKLNWILMPLIGSLAYFFLALQIVAHFSASSGYKFLVYYQWLGESLPEIAKNFFLKFPLVLQHLFTVANFELILGLFLLFLFIPIFRPKYLLLSLGIFLQIILGFASGELILRSHYSAVFVAAFSVATIFSLHALSAKPWAQKFYQKQKDLILLVVVTGLVYNFLNLGPIIPFVWSISQTDYQQVKLQNEFVRQIPAQASVITTYDLISNLSSREKLYSLNYVFLNRQQYGAGEYTVPSDTQYLLIDFKDFTTFYLQYGLNKQTEKYFNNGADNLLRIIQQNKWQLLKVSQNLGLWQKNDAPSDFSLFSLPEKTPDFSQEPQKIENLELLGYKKEQNKTELYWQALAPLTENYFLEINNDLIPLGFGLFPANNWPTRQTVLLNFYDLDLGGKIKLVTVNKGGLELNGLGSTKNVFDQLEVVGELTLE